MTSFIRKYVIDTSYWFPSPPVNPFEGRLGDVLFELQAYSLSQNLIDRAETAHIESKSTSDLAKQLLKWYDDEIQQENEEKEKERKKRGGNYARRLGLVKRLLELCDTEREWMFEFDKPLRERTLKLLMEYSEDTGDTSLIYYRNTLLTDASRGSEQSH